jgi:hypothetical protein
MNTQPTPKLDVWEAYCDECYYHMWRLRRKTERGWYDGFHIHTGEEAKGLCETLNKLERELNEAREQLAATREFMDYGFAKAREELATVTAQRDGIDSMYQKIIKEVLECDPIPACKREDDHLEPPWEVIARIREQRDMLAAVLQQCREDSVELVTERDRINAIINTFSNQ